jgi:hypothetical protein
MKDRTIYFVAAIFIAIILVVLALYLFVDVPPADLTP